MTPTNQNQDRLSVVAESIRALTYSEMLEIGGGLADIYTALNSFDTTSSNDWAALLHSWAENYGEM